MCRWLLSACCGFVHKYLGVFCVCVDVGCVQPGGESIFCFHVSVLVMYKTGRFHNRPVDGLLDN